MPGLRYKSYIICTSPRSGSTLLCKLLAATGKSGNPGSHFHNPSLAGWLQAYTLSKDSFATDLDATSAIFEAARRQGTRDTGIFGLRLQRRSCDFFLHQTGLLHPGLGSDMERIEAAFGRTLLIYLTRPNKLDQAVSLLKATQSGLWHRAADGTELERLSPPQEPAYDAVEIGRHLAELSEQDDAWKVWFDQQNLQPMQITYDALSDDPSGVLANILDQLGMDRALAQGISPPVARLADETNRIWAARFLAERDKRQNP